MVSTISLMTFRTELMTLEIGAAGGVAAREAARVGAPA